MSIWSGSRTSFVIMQNSPFSSHGGKQFFYANGKIPHEGHYSMHAYKRSNDEWRRVILGAPHVWHRRKWSTECQKCPHNGWTGQGRWDRVARWESQPWPLVIQLIETVMGKDLKCDLNQRFFFFISIISFKSLWDAGWSDYRSNPAECHTNRPERCMITGNWAQTI